MAEIYTYIKSPVSPAKLESEILASQDISIGCAYVAYRDSTSVDVAMKAPLSASELQALNTIVGAHAADTDIEHNTPVLVSVVENEKYGTEGLELSYRLGPKAFLIPDCAPGTEFRFEMTLPCTVMVLGGTVDVHQAMVGDLMWFETLCPTTIGYLAQDTVVGQSTGLVNVGAGAYIYKGFDILINDEIKGRVTCHSGDNFNMDTEWDYVYPAGTPVKVRYITVEEYRLTTAPMVVWISRDTERGAIVKNGQKMAFFYVNNSGTEKWVQICLEYHT